MCKMYGEQLRALQDVLQSLESVSLTVDIWSDRRLRSYLGITVHFIECDMQLSSALLCCERFHGEYSHLHHFDVYDVDEFRSYNDGIIFFCRSSYSREHIIDV